MAGNREPKWQQQVETILRKEFGEDEFWKQLNRAFELIDLAQVVELPSGDMGKIISTLLRQTSEELRPLAAAYTAFKLGMVYERLKNAERT